MKALIVQTDRKAAGFLGRVLAERGYTVDDAPSGRAALTRALSCAYDLIVLDWALGELGAVDVCREVRRAGFAGPMLVLSDGTDRPKESVQSLHAGADDYLVRPFDVDELTARVKALCRRWRGHNKLRIAALELDLDAQRATLDGTALNCTTREYKLLLYLAQRHGDIVPRTVLLTHVWSMHFDPESNVIDVHINHLRRKLGPHAWMIETIRNRGYRLRADDPG